MLTFRTYLWKEWRDHAKTVYVFWGLLVAATGILSFALPFEKLESGAVPSMLVGGSMMLAIALIGAELIPGDARRGTLQFLARTPSGLHTAFWTKLTFAFSSILLFGLSAWLVSSMFRIVIAPDLWKHPLSVVDAVLPVATVTLVATLWIFAISCWVPNGLLAVPAFGLLTIPYWIWWYLNPQGRNIYPWLDHAYWQPILALAVAWLSFVVGRRFGRTGAWSGGRGIGIAVLGSLPMWICLWSWHVDYRSFDPHTSSIQDAFLGRSGRFVFVTAQRPRNRGTFPKFALKVDLQHGTHEVLGAADSYLRPVADQHLQAASLRGVPHDKLILVSKSQDKRYIDTSTGTYLRNPSTQMGTREAWERAALRNATTWRTSDGRRAWMLGDLLEIETKKGSVREWVWKLRSRPVGTRGFWVQVLNPWSRRSARAARFRHPGYTVFDLDRLRLVTERPLKDGQHCVLGDRWLIRARDRSSLIYGPWRLLNARTGSEETLSCLRATDNIVTVLDQERLIVRGARDPNRKRGAPIRLDQHIFLVNLGDRSRTRLRFADPDLMVPSNRGSLIRGGSGYGVGPGDRKRRLFYIPGGRYVTLAPGSLQFTKAFHAHSIVGFLDDTRLLVTRGASPRALSLVEVDVETGEERLVFPRADSR